MTGWFPPTFLFDLNRVYLNNVVLQGARHVGFQIFFLAAGLERRQGLGVPALIKFDEFSVRKHNAKTAVGATEGASPAVASEVFVLATHIHNRSGPGFGQSDYG